MNEIDINERFTPFVPKTGIFAGISLIVDGTDCPVDRPGRRQNRDYLSNGRHKENNYSRYNLKYTVAVQIVSGQICHVIGSHGGSVSDISQLREGDLVAIIQSWSPFEILLADKGYQGHWKILTPLKGKYLSPVEEAFNEVLSSVRIIVECTIKRLKQFGVLGSRGRFHAGLTRHEEVFIVCSQITHISLELEPTWLHKNWFLREC